MKRTERIIRYAVVILSIIASTVCSVVAADELWVTTWTTGEIWKVDTVTGMTTFVARGPEYAEDAVIDCNGILYYGGMFTGVQRFDTNTEQFLPPAGIYIDGPEGPVVQISTGDVFVNTRKDPGVHTGVWRILAGSDPIGINVVPPFCDWGEGTAFLTSGPYAGDLVAAGSTGQTDLRRLVRSSPPDFGPAVTFIPDTDPLGDTAAVGVMVRPSDGHVFVANVHSFTTRITEFSPAGEYLGLIYFSGLHKAAFGEFDAQDNLYIAVTNRLPGGPGIHKITPDGQVSGLGDEIPGALGLAIKPNPFCGGRGPGPRR